MKHMSTIVLYIKCFTLSSLTVNFRRVLSHYKNLPPSAMSNFHLLFLLVLHWKNFSSSYKCIWTLILFNSTSFHQNYHISFSQFYSFHFFYTKNFPWILIHLIPPSLLRKINNSLIYFNGISSSWNSYSPGSSVLTTKYLSLPFGTSSNLWLTPSIVFPQNKFKILFLFSPFYLRNTLSQAKFLRGIDLDSRKNMEPLSLLLIMRFLRNLWVILFL